MPIETQRRGVVVQLTLARSTASVQVLHCLAGVHVHARGQDGGDVHVRGVALQHAVGDEHQPVAHLQLQRLHAVPASGLHSERAVSVQTNVLDLTAPSRNGGRWPALTMPAVALAILELGLQEFPVERTVADVALAAHFLAYVAEPPPHLSGPAG
jgi:hypothetical protein